MIKLLCPTTIISCALGSVACFAQAPAAPAAPSVPAAAAAAKGPSLAASLDAARAAMAWCAADGYKVSVSIVDSSGVLKLLTAADGVPQRPVETSVRKAYTAATLKLSTGEVAQHIKTDQALASRIGSDPRFVALPGGLVVKAGGEVIGALAVAGAPGGDKDEACARAGVEKLAAAGK